MVCSLTLCSVANPEASIAEIKRILKPGGKFLWCEHVLSQTDPALAQRQIDLTPQQVRRADGCHLDRNTGEVIQAAGFGEYVSGHVVGTRHRACDRANRWLTTNPHNTGWCPPRTRSED